MSASWEISSPDGGVLLNVRLSDTGALVYSIKRGEEAILADATFAIDTRPGALLCTGLAVQSASARARNESYPILAGKASEGRDHCEELHILLAETRDTRRRIEFQFRVYNDGVAFRYMLPHAAQGQLEIVAERSEFRFAADHRCWAMDLPHFQTPYESEYKPRRISELKPGQLVACPLTLQTDAGTAIAITEAGLSHFAGMYLEAIPGAPTGLLSRLAPRHDGTYACVRGTAPLASPWRVIQIAESPIKLVESNILYSLNAPCALPDTSWIKPGKVTWDWWCGHPASGRVQNPAMNNETMMDFIDFAAEMKLEYFLLDGGWYDQQDVLRSIPAIDLPMLVKYANNKTVDVLVWNHQVHLRPKLEEAFALYASLNIKGVKVDFFDRDDQEMVEYARRVVEVAARNKLLINLHGVFKPTGFERTYPNLMTHEGIMGAEYNKWSNRVTPEHNVTIPFTRMLAGPMDYTPGAFTNVTPDQFKPRYFAPMAMGTRCHNLAMYVVYQSALQMVSDYPDNIRNRRGSEFLKIVPAAWDQTVGLAGDIGEYVAIARRKGRDWFLGIMGNSQRRTLEIPLSFLGDGQYQATLYADGPHASSELTSGYRSVLDLTSLIVREGTFDKSHTLTVNLAPAGGLAAHFRAASS